MTRSAKPELALDAIARSVIKLRAVVPEDAFTAGILGSQRIGNGVVIGADGLLLTVGYLITEAADIWLTTASGAEIAAHPLAYDQASGFGLILPLQKLDIPAIPFGSSEEIAVGSQVHIVSALEFGAPENARVMIRRQFAGAWEYLLEDAIFAMPAHPHWSGAALLNSDGKLVGIGSLLVRETMSGEESNANMFIPIDLLKPILHDLLTRGQRAGPAKPWLGVYAVEVHGKIYVTGVVDGGPAQTADLREGDIINQIGDTEVDTLAEFYRCLWASGAAGTMIPLTLIRGGTRLQMNLRSVDRGDLLKRPQAN